VFEKGGFSACLHNVRTDHRRRLPLPAANVSRDGSKALCINMARMYDFRPGYGYEELPDPFASDAAPDRDGIFLMDLSTGRTCQLLSLAEIADFLRRSGVETGARKVLVNHITFNPSATRYLFLMRTFPEKPGVPWSTFLLTASTTGGDLRLHPVWDLASHYYWRDDDAMLFYAKIAADDGNRLELALISDQTDSREVIDREFFKRDGHCSYSPDGRFILYDSYPDRSTPQCLRDLSLYDLEKRRGLILGRFRSEPYDSKTVDLRCDLHPRWMPSGKAVTFDSIHEGFRGVYWADLNETL
jgi:hypothetical protein